GTDLMPFISKDGKPTSEAPHQHLFWRGGHYQVAMTDGWKMHKADRPNKVWLFNMNDDPTEQNNVAQHHPERVASMLKLLDQHNATQIEPAWPALLEAPTPIDRTAEDPRDPNEEYVYWPN
ncbi:MAG: sulfatase, partial [Candidatus Hydrogenedentota bacterium]